MTADVTMRDALAVARVEELRGVGLDGACYLTEAGGASAEMWRLEPTAIDAAARRRLRALAQLSHPNLVRIAELSLDEPRPTLRLAEGRHEWEALASIGDLRAALGGLAGALAAAHKLDVVHGALGPAAVGVDAEGQPVLDLTRLRVRPGQPPPLAPELAQGATPSAAADVWALGHMLAALPGADALPELARMCDPDPERRPRAAEVAGALGAAPGLVAPAPPVGESDAARFGIPEQLGAYALDEQIGAGGMGRVFRARDVASGDEVALKVLLSNWAKDPELVARFRREARVLAQVESPYVTRFVAANEDEGFHYLVMELASGQSAEALLKERRRLDVDLAVGVLCDVSRAVGEMHALGLVHRDIKPANILVDQDGPEPVVKLCDFGIARKVSPEPEQQLTQAGAPGTPSYMSPEQVEGRTVDARTDVYALGATLYCLLAGRPPFVGTAHIVMIAHLSDEPTPLRDHDPSIPQAVSDVVMRCLAKSPDERYADANALHEALHAAWRGATEQTIALPQPHGLEGKPRVYDFAWPLRADPEELWPHVSNTERLNRAAGLDDVEWTHSTGEGYVQTEGSFRAAGMELRWRENPFEWVAPRRLGVVREYVAGPFEWLRSTVELTPREGGGTELRHKIEIRPRGLLGVAAATVEVGMRLRRGLERVYRRIDTACMTARESARPGSMPPVDPFEPPQRATDRLRARVDGPLERVVERGGDPHVAEALASHVCTAPAQRLGRLRPRAWARAHGFEESLVVDTMLLAADEGLLEVLWDILCPSCRIPSGIEESLRALGEHGRCEVCDLDFELDMARSVELVFRVHPSIRPADVGVYCIGGPAHSPHVVAQVRLVPRERFALSLDLAPGRFHVTGRGLPQRWSFTVDERAVFERWDLPLREGASPDVPRSLRPGRVQILLTNDFEQEVVVRLERATLRDDAVTAADAAASALFRDLFPDQVLAPERLVAIADVALLFARVVDALDRFEREETEVHRELVALSSEVEAAAHLEGGALVKLHGDGVMAVFSDRVAAVRAALRVTRPDATVGLGLHAGPARMTSIGGQLDYFGKTLHLAEHISRVAHAGELVVSEALLEDPRMVALFAEGTETLGYVRVGSLLAGRLRTRALQHAS
ncbi:MAG: protein kinase [Sandaracinaceae bacterium]